MREYNCVVCGEPLNRSNIHNHYLLELARKFHEEGFKLIVEGKIPFLSSEEWQEPDLFILDDNNCLVKIVEVIVGDPYEAPENENSVYFKCKKIKDYYDPQEIIVFEPTDYLDITFLHERKKHYKKELGYEPTSYKEIQTHFQKKWEKNGLNVVFWNEENLVEKHIEKLRNSK